jgi:MFS family permease
LQEKDPRLTGAVYMHEAVGVRTGYAGIAFGAFSLGMITSRFAADALSARFGPTLVTRAGGLVAAGGLAAALTAPHGATAVAGYLLFGFGLGPIVPIAFSAAGNVDDSRTGAILGSVVMLGYVGSVVAPMIIGFTADAVSLRVALVFPFLLALGIAALAFSVSTAAGGARVDRRTAQGSGAPAGPVAPREQWPQ